MLGSSHSSLEVNVGMQNRMAMVASLGFLVGCARETMVVTPRTLPALAENQVIVYTRTRDGKQVVEHGPIRGVVVQGPPLATSKGDTDRDPAHIERFRAPFEAKLSGDQLQLSNEEGQSRYALRDIQEVEVQYDVRVDDPRKGMRIAGIVLTSLGGAALGTGFALLGVVAHSSGAAAGLVVVAPFTLSPVLAGVGIPLWVAGAPAPSGVPATIPLLAPKAYGAGLRWAF
jgi:hypothetical protein